MFPVIHIRRKVVPERERDTSQQEDAIVARSHRRALSR